MTEELNEGPIRIGASHASILSYYTRWGGSESCLGEACKERKQTEVSQQRSDKLSLKKMPGYCKTIFVTDLVVKSISANGYILRQYGRVDRTSHPPFHMSIKHLTATRKEAGLVKKKKKKDWDLLCHHRTSEHLTGAESSLQAKHDTSLQGTAVPFRTGRELDSLLIPFGLEGGSKIQPQRSGAAWVCMWVPHPEPSSALLATRQSLPQSLIGDQGPYKGGLPVTCCVSGTVQNLFFVCVKKCRCGYIAPFLYRLA